MTMTTNIVDINVKKATNSKSKKQTNKPVVKAENIYPERLVDANIHHEALVRLGKLEIYNASELEERNKSNWTECKNIVKRLYPRW